jgi:hypothetical protein
MGLSGISYAMVLTLISIIAGGATFKNVGVTNYGLNWAAGHSRLSNGEQAEGVTALAMANKPSVDFSGYWQRHIAKEAAN